MSRRVRKTRRTLDMRQNAYKRWNAMLNQYEEPPMAIETREALLAYIAKRKEELPDAWY